MKTKVFFFVIALISTVVIFSSCESKSGKRVKEMKNQTITEEVVRISQQEYDSLIDQGQRLKNLKEYNEWLEKYISNLKKNPSFFLLVLDSELSAIEKSQDPYGSFSDYFVPTIHEALDAGVSRIEIQKRINKLVQLANKGYFISSYEEELFKEGGAKAIVQAIGLEQ